MSESEIEGLYQKWVHDNGLRPLTSTQSKFAKFLLEHHVIVGKIGDMESVFKSVRKFLRK